MNFTIFISLASAAAGFFLAWQLQAHDITKLKLEHTNERIAIQRAARATIERTATAVIQAQNNAASRVAVHRLAAADARGAVERLRDELDVATRAANTSFDACTVAAATTSGLLHQCAARYSELADKAQGHVSDVRTLMEAWPK
jgi:hypothetical protein